MLLSLVVAVGEETTTLAVGKFDRPAAVVLVDIGLVFSEKALAAAHPLSQSY
jgi:hypothetical protein